MIRNKCCDVICVIVMCLAVAVTLIFINGSYFGIQLVHDDDAEAAFDSTYFTENDMKGDWDTSSATEIRLEGDDMTVRGNGAYEWDGDLYIAQSGYYVVSGTLDNGSIIVDAEKNSKVWVQLNGVTIYADDDACFRVEQADKVFLTLASGSENTMVSGETYSDEALEDKVDGTIFARDDLTINGSGTLNVTANYKFGIAANDELVITGGTLNVNGVTSAIHVNDSFRITQAQVNLTSGTDGIHVAGNVVIAGGEITIEAGDDGIHSDADLMVLGGTILINSCYEGLEGANITVEDGDITIYPTDDGLNAASDTVNDEEASIPMVTVNGGIVRILNASGNDADGIDSNGSIIINGGEVYISLTGNGSNCALDYGSENGGVCEINGGKVIACGSSSMVEEISSGSAQASVLYYTPNGGSDNTAITLSDESGNQLLNWTVPYSFNAVILSCPEMTVDNHYKITVGETTQEITVSEIAAQAGSTGSAGAEGPDTDMTQTPSGRPEGMTMPDDAAMPEGSTPPEDIDMSDDFTPPEDTDMSDDSKTPKDREMPDGSEIPGGTSMPDGAQPYEDATTIDDTSIVPTKEMMEIVGACAAFLVVGIGFAAIYKKRRHCCCFSKNERKRMH